MRSYADRPIPDDVFAAILEAGRLAPSTVNLQSWAFVDVHRRDVAGGVRPAHPLPGSRAVVVCADSHRARAVLDAFPASPLVEYTIAVMNASLAAMNMNIAAEALGVSSVMLSETGRSGLLDARYLQDKLELPGSVIPIMTIVFGYAEGLRLPMPPKLPLDAGVLRGPVPRGRPGRDARLAGGDDGGL